MSLVTVRSCQSYCLRASPFSYADVLKEESLFSSGSPASELVELTKGTDAETAAEEAEKKLNAFEYKRKETLSKIEAARSRIRETRIDTSKILSEVAFLRAPKGNPTQSILLDTESSLAGLKADAAKIDAESLSISKSQSAKVAEAMRLAKTQLSLVSEQTSILMKELDAVRKGDDESRLAAAKAESKARIQNAESRLKDAVNLPPIDRKIALGVAFVAGLLFSKAINLDDIDLYVAAAFSAIMFTILPRD